MFKINIKEFKEAYKKSKLEHEMHITQVGYRGFMIKKRKGGYIVYWRGKRKSNEYETIEGCKEFIDFHESPLGLSFGGIKG